MARHRTQPRSSPVTVNLPIDLLERLDRYAEATTQPKTQVIRQALQEYLDGIEKRARETMAARMQM